MRSTLKKVLPLLMCFLCLSAQTNERAQTLDWKQSIATARELHDEGNFSGGIIEAQRALTLAEKSFGKNDARVAETLDLLALLHRLEENGNSAVPFYVRAIEIRRTLNGDKNDLAETLFQLADTYNLLRKSSAALSAYQEALALSEPLEKSDSIYLFDRVRDLARTYRDLQRYPEAERLYIRYLEIERLKQVRSLYLSYEEVAQYYRTRRSYSKAEEYYSLALSAMKTEFAENDPNIALMMRRAAEIYTEEKKYNQANSILDEALVILRRESPLSPASFANVYADMARNYKRMNNREKAMEYLSRANSMLLKERTVFIEPYRYKRLEE